MQINDFNYRQTPVKKTRQYEVHVLSPDGLNQYLNKNSYLHNFLQSPSAMYKNINKKETGYNFHENYSLQSPCEEDEKHYHRKNDVISLGRDTLKKFYPRNSTNSQAPNQNQKIVAEENYKSPEIENFSSPQHQHRQQQKNEEQKNYWENQEKQVSDFGVRNLEVKKNSASVEPFRTHDSLNKQKSFLQTSKNFVVGSSRNSIKNVAQATFYNKDKYRENYRNSLNNLKSCFDNDAYNFGNNNIKNNLTNSGNFKSYDIPHLNYKRGSDNFRINLIRNKLEKTLLTGQNKEKNPNDTLIASKTNEGFDEINEKIKGENDKLRKYMNHIHKNSEERMKSHPNLKDIMNSTSLRTTKMKLMNNKYMGERYNPSNYQ